MDAIPEYCREPLLVCLLVATRISGLVLLAPCFGTRGARLYLRVGLILALTWLVSPLYWTTGLPFEPRGENLLEPLCREAVLGLSLGLAIYALSAALQAAGQIAGQLSGMSLAQSTDASAGSEPPLFARLFDLVTIAAFLLIGGHRQVLSALLDTFQWMPPGKVGFSGGMIATLSEVVAAGFELALRASAPVLAALLVATVMLGLIQRALPQWNTLSLGLGLNSLLALAVVSLSLSGAAWAFQQHVATAVDSLISAATDAKLPPSMTNAPIR